MRICEGGVITLWRHGTAVTAIWRIRSSWSVGVGRVGRGLRELVAVAVARMRASAGRSAAVRGPSVRALRLSIAAPLDKC